MHVPAVRGQDASGNDGDLSARANGGKVVMGLWDDDNNADLGNLSPQVLGVTLGTFRQHLHRVGTGNELPGQSLARNAIARRQFVERCHGVPPPGGSTAANLFYWNGSDTTGGGDPNFVPVSAGTTLSMTVVRTGQSTTAITADGSANPSVGLHWGQKIDGNILHQHPNTSLQKTAGTPAEGIYLLGLKFYMTDNTTAINPSDLVLLPFEATDGNAANNPSQDAAFYDNALSTAITWAADNYSSFQAVPRAVDVRIGRAWGFAGLLICAQSKGEEAGITKSSVRSLLPGLLQGGRVSGHTHSFQKGTQSHAILAYHVIVRIFGNVVFHRGLLRE